MARKVLIQRGHVAPREPGFESGTGTAGEQEFATKVANRLANLLSADSRFEPIVVPGDIPDGVKVDAALFLHADGSRNPQSSGFSFGYPDYPVNKRLADLIAAEFLKLKGHPPHRSDNYTGGLRAYYGYRRVDTSGPEVLVEHGFLTNPAERGWMNANIGYLAKAEYLALLRYFNLPPEAKPKRRADYVLVIEGEDGSVKRQRIRYPNRTAAVANALRRDPPSIRLERA